MEPRRARFCRGDVVVLLLLLLLEGELHPHRAPERLEGATGK